MAPLQHRLQRNEPDGRENHDDADHHHELKQRNASLFVLCHKFLSVPQNPEVQFHEKDAQARSTEYPRAKRGMSPMILGTCLYCVKTPPYRSGLGPYVT